MRTEIRTFCEEYAQQLDPFEQGLQSALKKLPENTDDPLLKQWRMRLQEVAHRAETLSGKIAQQQAFLLIFGPLKSGKSTLMNAISGAYVSEVSSLPAYPALVHVKHGERRAFQATDYAGKKTDFPDSSAMSKAIHKSHQELADKILEVERDGEVFEPHSHFPSAIRRMEVVTPAESLAESGSVLVDTPGLYTRMRFGYDVMTRDFRDNAACAIFVVKSDNLFFEKVFEEFNELLGHFSRIFLVVNIDSSKQDLQPNGELKPSLESRDPKAVTDAFQSLAMSAPLREAYDRGNLNVYTIDLLKAASARLKAASGESEESAAASDENFDRFLGDLTDYLNSSDYLREFMHDSVRVGENLQGEVSNVASVEAPQHLRSEAEKWESLLKETSTRLAALEQLQKIDWRAAFEDIHTEKDRLLASFSERNGDELSQKLSESIDEWMATDDSLRALRDDHLNKHIESETAGDTEKILQHLKERMETRNLGAHFSNEEAKAFEEAGIRMDQIAPDLLEKLVGEEAPAPPRIPMDPEHMPIKRGFWDVVLFRSKDSVRRKLFGPNGTEFVASAKKAKYIGEQQQEELRQRLKDFPEAELPEIQSNYVTELLESYVQQLSSALEERCQSMEVEARETKERCEQELRANLEAQRIFEALAKTNSSFASGMTELRQRYGAQDESLEAGGEQEGQAVPVSEAEVMAAAAAQTIAGEPEDEDRPA
ncbi:dynamin family protein [Pelagicoccus albus]|uniref:Dynamin family protein n=1 Tax=Pelagicoccus albus TaxID=415222 RepID=A0A7X1E906_9BACT|nr:dynamin family protein [Pelagicoccus albus]MBC2606693.1 dynamin family protein [Pelagicoccus albus]